MTIDYFQRSYRDARRKVLHKASAYSLTPNDNGTLVTNKGAAGSVTVKLPPPIVANRGLEFEFVLVAAQPLVISCDVTDVLVAYGDAAADTVTLTGTIGNGAIATCDGANWLIRQHTAFNGTTHVGVTVTT